MYILFCTINIFYWNTIHKYLRLSGTLWSCHFSVSFLDIPEWMPVESTYKIITGIYTLTLASTTNYQSDHVHVYVYIISVINAEWTEFAKIRQNFDFILSQNKSAQSNKILHKKVKHALVFHLFATDPTKLISIHWL